MRCLCTFQLLRYSEPGVDLMKFNNFFCDLSKYSSIDIMPTQRVLNPNVKIRNKSAIHLTKCPSVIIYCDEAYNILPRT